MKRASINPSIWKHATWWGARLLAVMALLPFLSGAGLAQPGQFDSGSNGSDGALSLTTPGTYIFDPRTFNPPLDVDGDNVYNFTTINIAAGVTVRMPGPQLNMKPVFWLASGAVQAVGPAMLLEDLVTVGAQPMVITSWCRWWVVPAEQEAMARVAAEVRAAAPY